MKEPECQGVVKDGGLKRDDPLLLGLDEALQLNAALLEGEDGFAGRYIGGGGAQRRRGRCRLETLEAFFAEQLGDRFLLTLVSDGEVGAHVALDE